jgi:plastocyanin
MTQSPTTRRHLLKATGTVALVGLAGCTNTGTTGEGQPTPTETATPTRAEDHHEDDHHDDDHHDDDHHDDDHEHADEEIPTGPSPRATVQMTSTAMGQHFEPHMVWVEEGGTVAFVNASGAHSATAYHPDFDKPQRVPDGTPAWDTGVLSGTDETVEVTFETEGVYDFYCIPHEALGMVGTVIVGHPDPQGQPGLAPPQASLPEEARTTIESLNERCMEALEHAS